MVLLLLSWLLACNGGGGVVIKDGDTDAVTDDDTDSEAGTDEGTAEGTDPVVIEYGPGRLRVQVTSALQGPKDGLEVRERFALDIGPLGLGH